MKEITYSIPNISCNHCVHTIKMEVSEIPGVISVEPDAMTKTTTIKFNPPASEDKIEALLSEINYPASKYKVD